MYIINYMYAEQILETYKLIGVLNNENEHQECLLIDCHDPIGIVLNRGFILSHKTKQPLKNLIRCYIIKQDSLLESVSLTEIIDRYR